VNICSRGGAFNSVFAPQYLKNELAQEVESSGKRVHFSGRKTVASCLSNIGQVSASNRILQQYSAFLDAEDHGDTPPDTDPEPKNMNSKKGYFYLAEKYMKATGAEKENYKQLLYNHPQADYYMTDLEVNDIYDKAHGDLKLINRQLDQYFDVEINYEMANYLEKYYFSKARNLLRQDRDLALEDMLKQLATIKTLSLEYFNFVLFQIDEFDLDSGKWPRLTDLRFEFWNHHPATGPANIRKLEVATALAKGENYFCTIRKNPRVCSEIKVWIQSNDVEYLIKKSLKIL
jgi:hypothetical protein